MKNNPVAKFAGINQGGFHTKKNKPDDSYEEELYVCDECQTYDDSEGECLFCGSLEKTKIN
jgi:hypothetical protein